MITENRILFIGFVAALLLPSCSSDNKNNDLSREELKGKVKSLIITTYNAKEKFGEAEKEEVISKSNSKYNEQGFLTEFSAQGSVFNTNYTYKSKSKQDDKGRTIEFYDYSTDGVVNHKRLIKYDDRGNPSEVAEFDSLGNLMTKTTIKYDGQGHDIEDLEYTAQGGLKSKGLTFYDERGNKSKVTIYDSKGNVETKMDYSYDSKNNLISDSWCGADTNQCFVNTYKYDDRGSQIENYWSRGNSHASYKYRYSYDKYNWITKVKYYGGSLSEITERQIEYY